MSDTIEETDSQYSATRCETTLIPIKGRVIKLKFDLVSGISSSFPEESHDEPTYDQHSIDPVILNIKKCFMLRKSSKSSNSSRTETVEARHEETTPTELSNIILTSNDMLVSKSGDTLATENLETSEPEIEDPIEENTLVNVIKSSVDRVILKKTRNRPVKVKTFVCVVCKKGFVFKTPYEKHLLIHTEGYCAKLFKCNVCDKRFLKQHIVNKHFKQVHMAAKILVCGECPKHFRSGSGLRDHKKSQHGPRDESLSCPTCGKNFVLKKSLKNHLKTFPDHGEIPT